MQIPYSLIRSKRRTLSIHINDMGKLIVRAPMRLSVSHIEDFLVQKKNWIEKHQKKRENNTPRKILNSEDIQSYKNHLKTYIIPRIHELWQGKGLPPLTSIKITQSEKRWGSCSSKNGLCFSYRLAEYLEQDSILSSRGLSLSRQAGRDPFQNQVGINNSQNLISEGKSDSSAVLRNDNKKSFIDAIIIHELAHFVHKNHQKSFWNLVYSWMPDYDSAIKNK